MATRSARSHLLWQYADREVIRRSIKHDLRGSDGPLDTCDRIPFTFDASCLSTSFHGGGRVDLRKKAAPAYHVNPDQLLFINGGTSQANHHVVHALTQAGDVIVVEHPVYDPLTEASRITRCKIETLTRRPEDDFQISGDRLRTILKDHNPRLIVISNLHNPSCVAVRNMEELLSVLREHNEGKDRPSLLVVDEVYRDLATEDIRPAASLSPYAVSTFGLSKSYGLSGLRHGLIIATPQLIDVILGYYTLVGVCNSSLSESLWTQFYDHRERVLQENRQRQRHRQKIVEDALLQNNIPFTRSDGGTVILAKLPTDDDVAFSTGMADKYDASVNPGTNFGLPGYARIGFMNVSEEAVREGIAAFCKHWKDACSWCLSPPRVLSSSPVVPATEAYL
ncbi:aminotransferase [Planoprotostelium fungivorum]|uniref:Aminotransferase n=1 Tax=Planoprotostelium fungivorum TaxID=1890364 RepID=A0A2P6MYW4_9EUKA|nr:aminotransferase [Planoprotostelium fungivorum]